MNRLDRVYDKQIVASVDFLRDNGLEYYHYDFTNPLCSVQRRVEVDENSVCETDTTYVNLIRLHTQELVMVRVKGDDTIEEIYLPKGQYYYRNDYVPIKGNFRFDKGFSPVAISIPSMESTHVYLTYLDRDTSIVPDEFYDENPLGAAIRWNLITKEVDMYYGMSMNEAASSYYRRVFRALKCSVVTGYYDPREPLKMKSALVV